MSIFEDTNPCALRNFLSEIYSRTAVFPDFQRDFVWKPYAMTVDEKIEFVWCGDVVATDKGGEKLLKRAHRMVSIT